MILCYGHSRRGRLTCGRCGHRRQCCKTYFGMALCRECWDGWWRAEGGEGAGVDPPFAEITNPAACVLITP